MYSGIDMTLREQKMFSLKQDPIDFQVLIITRRRIPGCHFNQSQRISIELFCIHQLFKIHFTQSANFGYTQAIIS